MSKLMTIGETAKWLGVSAQTLRRWEREGRIKPAQRTPGGQRRYDLQEISHKKRDKDPATRKTIAYARVSSYDQKQDLERQREMLAMYCASQGWSYEIISDLGSGMNYRKKGLKKLIEGILNGDMSRLVLTHKDRLLRFGAELIFSLCEEKGVEVVLMNQGDEPTFEEELAQDVLEMITVFSARLYGSRSRKNKKLIGDMRQAVENAKS